MELNNTHTHTHKQKQRTILQQPLKILATPLPESEWRILRVLKKMVAHQVAPLREYALTFLPQGVTPQNIAPESYIRVTGKKRNNHQIKSI